MYPDGQVQRGVGDPYGHGDWFRSLVVRITGLCGCDVNRAQPQDVECRAAEGGHLFIVDTECYRQAAAGRYVQLDDTRITVHFRRGVEGDGLASLAYNQRLARLRAVAVISVFGHRGRDGGRACSGDTEQPA